MNLFLLGATGRTGRLVVEQALSRGHAVTTMTRKPGTLRSHERLEIITGNPLCADDLVPVLANQHAVISCLGQRSAQDATLLHDAAVVALDAMARAGVRRYLVISQGLLFPSWNPIVALLRLILARHCADSRAMEHVLRASNVEWTIVRPPYLKEGGTPRGYRVQSGAQPGGAWAMQRADLAAFLLDEAERGEHKNVVVGITSA
jgi:putative NADH-flavin reductase